MLDEYLQTLEVQNFLNDLKTNPRLYKKKVFAHGSYGNKMGDELTLYIFYDALIKYKIIIDNIHLFHDYFAQVRKLFLRFSDAKDLITGVHRILCNMVASMLGIRDVDSKDDREEIIRYIYDKYIIHGYYYHGFSTIYEGSIARDGFTSEIYQNYYQDMNQVNQIFEKYHVYNIMGKDFKDNSTYFTDDFVMGCYYSITSPGYYHRLLFNPEVYGEKVIHDGYLVQDYYSSTYFLKKYMNYYQFSEEDKRFINHVVDEEWGLLKKQTRKVSVLMVQRSLVRSDTNLRLSDYLAMKERTQVIIDRMLCPKNNQIRFNEVLRADQFTILSLEDFYRGHFAADSVDLSELNIEREEKEEKIKEEAKKAALIQAAVQRKEEDDFQRNKIIQDFNGQFVTRKPLNAVGMASALILFGTVCISLGVIIAVTLILRGI